MEFFVWLLFLKCLKAKKKKKGGGYFLILFMGVIFLNTILWQSAYPCLPPFIISFIPIIFFFHYRKPEAVGGFESFIKNLLLNLTTI